jgi:hypothetical protein
MVAWHGVPGKARPWNPSRRARYEGISVEFKDLTNAVLVKRFRVELIKPCPTGRILNKPIPRHFVPGYHHIVPPGQLTIGGIPLAVGDDRI